MTQNRSLTALDEILPLLNVKVLLVRQRAKVGRANCDFLFPGRRRRKNMNADFLAVIEFWERRRHQPRCPCRCSTGSLLSAAKKAVGSAREIASRNRQKKWGYPGVCQVNHCGKSHFEARPISLFDARRIKADARSATNRSRGKPGWLWTHRGPVCKAALMTQLRRARKSRS